LSSPGWSSKHSYRAALIWDRVPSNPIGRASSSYLEIAPIKTNPKKTSDTAAMAKPSIFASMATSDLDLREPHFGERKFSLNLRFPSKDMTARFLYAPHLAAFTCPGAAFHGSHRHEADYRSRSLVQPQWRPDRHGLP